jgi:putative endonuclease
MSGVGMFYTYLLASAPHGTLYVGHTDDLSKRVSQHRLSIRANFTSKYGVHHLVWYAAHDTREGAFSHERRIKKWNRAWKVRLIETDNPSWADLFDEWYPPEPDLTQLGLPPSRE